jgi:hypothetical protein
MPAVLSNADRARNPKIYPLHAIGQFRLWWKTREKTLNMNQQFSRIFPVERLVLKTLAFAFIL